MFDDIFYKIFSYVHILMCAIKKNFVREEKKIRKEVVGAPYYVLA
jgi:hypothetical protein